MMEIDTELLISLVEAKPVLWDKSLKLYKNRNGTRKAWEEVCVGLKSDFNELQNNDKNLFGYKAIKRWTNIRDAFAKFSKKEREKTKYGTEAFKHKKYIYSDKLNFLKKLYPTRDEEDDFGKDTASTSYAPRPQPINSHSPALSTPYSYSSVDFSASFPI